MASEVNFDLGILPFLHCDYLFYKGCDSQNFKFIVIASTSTSIRAPESNSLRKIPSASPASFHFRNFLSDIHATSNLLTEHGIGHSGPQRPRRSRLTSESNSVTSITHVDMSFWPVNASGELIDRK